MANFIILSLNILLVGLSVAEVPSYINVCGLQNKDFDGCVKNSVEALRQKLHEGIPELDVPSLNPLHIVGGVPFELSDGLRATTSNIKLHNVSDFEITNLHVDHKNQSISIGLHFDAIRLQGDYEFSGKILVQIEARGNIDLTGEDINGNGIMHFVLHNTKKGQQLFFTGMSIKMHIKDYKLHFKSDRSEAVFDNAINSVLNTNRREIIDAFNPALEKTVSSNVLEIANKIVKHFTYAELFPDHE